MDIVFQRNLGNVDMSGVDDNGDQAPVYGGPPIGYHIALFRLITGSACSGFLKAFIAMFRVLKIHINGQVLLSPNPKGI